MYGSMADEMNCMEHDDYDDKPREHDCTVIIKTNNELLKPCPFCGEKAIFVRITNAFHSAGSVYCEKCGTDKPSVETWNNRYKGV